MKEIVDMIVAGSETFTPEVLIRLFVFMVISDCIFGLCHALLALGRR